MTHKYESHTDEKMKTRKKAVSKMTRHNYQYHMPLLVWKLAYCYYSCVCNYSHSLKKLFSKLPLAPPSYFYN